MSDEVLPAFFDEGALPAEVAEVVWDIDPPELEGEYLEQYHQERDRFDQAFVGFPEHQKSVLWVLSRRLAEAHVSVLVPEVRRDAAIRAIQDRALVALIREVGAMTRAVDHLEVQKTQLLITILAVVGDVAADTIEDRTTRKGFMKELRRRSLQLFGGGE